MKGGGITKALTELLAAAGIQLDPWVGPAVALGFAILLFPWFLRNIHTSRARKFLKRSAGLGGVVRDEMESQALALVSTNPMGQIAIAEEAVRQGRYRLARDILKELQSEKRSVLRERRRLLVKMEPRDPVTLAAAILVIERLQAQGMQQEALRRVQRFLRRWPEASDLKAMAAQLSTALTDTDTDVSETSLGSD